MLIYNECNVHNGRKVIPQGLHHPAEPEMISHDKHGPESSNPSSYSLLSSFSNNTFLYSFCKMNPDEQSWQFDSVTSRMVVNSKVSAETTEKCTSSPS